MKIATEHAEAHCKRAGQGMEEWFLFHGIQLQRADVTVGDQQTSSTIESHPAYAIQTVEDDTTMPACEAAHAAIFQLFVKLALLGVSFQDPFKGRCFSTHKICLPKADKINSIPKCAVLLWISRMGLISVISKEAIFFVSAIISMARCASR